MESYNNCGLLRGDTQCDHPTTSFLLDNLWFVPWPKFSSSPCEHLLARDGLHTSYEGTKVVARKSMCVEI